MQKISLWLKNSHLTLNIDKTVSVFFKNQQNILAGQLETNITIDGQNILNVDEVKYLGVILDQNLTFKSHIKKLSNTLKLNISNFRYIRKSLTTEASSTYLNAMIIPHFRYCMTSWSQACRSTLKPLEILYKRSLKVHDQKPRQYHHCRILSKYNILSFENIITHSNLCLLFKIIHGAAAPPLRKFISLSSEATSRVTRFDCSWRVQDS